MAGPIIAFGVIAWLSQGSQPSRSTFESLFVIAMPFAISSVVVLSTLVPNIRSKVRDVSLCIRDTLVLFREGSLRKLMLAGGALGLPCHGQDAFLYLALADRHDLAEAWFPLPYVGPAAASLVRAVPIGRLADRKGRVRVWLLGYLPLLAAYLVVLLPITDSVAIMGSFGLLDARPRLGHRRCALCLRELRLQSVRRRNDLPSADVQSRSLRARTGRCPKLRAEPR